MKLLANGKEVPILGLSVTDSLGQYYESFVMTVPARLTVRSVVIETTTRGTYYILREELHGTNYVYTLVAEKVYELLNTVFPTVTGTYTLIQVLAKLGLRCTTSVNSSLCYWHIPSMKFSSLMDYLETYTLLPRGGAPYFNVDSSGAVGIYDLRTLFTKAPVKELSPSTIGNVTAYVDWIQRAPGVVNLTVYKPTGITTSKFVIEDGCGNGKALVNDTTGHEEELYKRALTTSYYHNKFTSRKIEIPLGVDVVNVGDVVSLTGIGNFVVYTRTSNIPVVDDEPVKLSYLLVSAI